MQKLSNKGDRKINMSKLNKILLTFISLCLAAFIVTFVCWLVRYNMIIRPMLDNPHFEPDENYFAVQDYSFDIENASAAVYIPAFPRFKGNLCVASPTIVCYDEEKDANYVENEVQFSFVYSPELFAEKTYDIIVFDYSDTGFVDTDEIIEPSASYRFLVDKDLNYLEGFDDKAIYDKYEDQLRQFYKDNVLDAFSEELFK